MNLAIVTSKLAELVLMLLLSIERGKLEKTICIFFVFHLHTFEEIANLYCEHDIEARSTFEGLDEENLMIIIVAFVDFLTV